MTRTGARAGGLPRKLRRDRARRPPRGLLGPARAEGCPRHPEMRPRPLDRPRPRREAPASRCWRCQAACQLHRDAPRARLGRPRPTRRHGSGRPSPSRRSIRSSARQGMTLPWWRIESLSAERTTSESRTRSVCRTASERDCNQLARRLDDDHPCSDAMEIGTRTSTVVPRPGSLRMLISPFSRDVVARATSRPIPLPDNSGDVV